MGKGDDDVDLFGEESRSCKSVTGAEDYMTTKEKSIILLEVKNFL